MVFGSKMGKKQLDLLRSEFLWQEGHAIHETKEDARTIRMLMFIMILSMNIFVFQR